MKTFALCGFALFAAIFTGCVTSGPKSENGPQGTIAHLVQVESSEPGARVEANNEYIGKTPLTLKIFGDKDGTFHNFGTQEYIVRCYPVNTNQQVQSKVFRTGFWFMPEDRIPSRIYFDLNERSSGFSLDVPAR